MIRVLAGLALGFAAALLAAGLTFSASSREPADLVFVNGTEPKSLDPHVATGEPASRILWALFDGLTRFDARTLEPVPAAARSWELSPDLETWVFRLRDEARWSDGRPVTAHDFVASWKRLLDPATGSEYAYILYPLRGAEAFHAYAAHAEALEGPIREALDALRQSHPEGVPADDWQRFLAARGVHEAVRGSADGHLDAALARRAGRLPPAELGRVAAALSAEARRRRALSERAARHFGVDSGVYARDDHTLVVELAAPTPYFLEITAFFATLPVPVHALDAPGGAWFLPGHIVTNGPYRLERWVVNDRIRLVRNEGYWGRDHVRLHSIDALPTENTTTALNLYLTGEVDWLPKNYPAELVDQLKAREDFYSRPGMVVYYYRFNCSRPPFDDPRVRRAVNLAIDRRVVTDQVLALGQLPAAHFVPPGMPGYDPPASDLRLSLARARELLAEAGYPGGKGFPEVGILYNTFETHKKIAEVIADQLRRNLGIPVVTYNQEWQSYLATVRSGSYDLARAGWIGDYRDPNTFLDLWVSNGGNNQTGWSSARYDRLIQLAADVEQLSGEADPVFSSLSEPARARSLWARMRAAGSFAERVAAGARLRMQLLREAEAILLRELPIAPLYFYVNSGLVRPHVKGFYTEVDQPDGSRIPNLRDIHPLRSLWVEARDAGGRG